MARARTAAAPPLAGAAPVFAALGDETRLNVIARLCASGPQSIARLTEGASVSRQAITKHLHALAQAGLVRSKRAGRERIWEIPDEASRRGASIPRSDLRAVGRGARATPDARGEGPLNDRAARAHAARGRAAARRRVLAVVAPWFFYKAMRFKLSNTTWRGVRFGFDSTVGEAYAALAPAVILWVLLAARW